MQKADADDSLVISYLSLRKAVGIIGFALPFVLAIGTIVVQDKGIQPSISAYYYTDLRNIFVGSLCAIGVFLMSTRGYPEPKLTASLPKDHIAGILASIFAIGVAFFPTTPAHEHPTVIGGIHLTFAALLFLTLAYFCLKLFTRTAGNPTRQKLKRNIVYRVSGYTILASILLIAVAAIPLINAVVEHLNPRFWLESLAILAFAVAWLTKGEVILKDAEDQTSISSPEKRSAASTL